MLLLTEAKQQWNRFLIVCGLKCVIFLFNFCCASAKKKSPTLSQSSPHRVQFIITARISLKHLKHHREDGDWVGLAAVLLPCRSGEILFILGIQHVLPVRHRHGIYPRPAPEDEQENSAADKGKEHFYEACSLFPKAVFQPLVQTLYLPLLWENCAPISFSFLLFENSSGIDERS